MDVEDSLAKLMVVVALVQYACFSPRISKVHFSSRLLIEHSCDRPPPTGYGRIGNSLIEYCAWHICYYSVSDHRSIIPWT